MSFDLRRADTICAPATARGQGAIAVVRVSGADAFAVRSAVFRGLSVHGHRTVVRGDVVGDDGEIIDDALCASFHAPRSLTGEDIFELSTHGGAVVVELVLARLRALGCRMAEPGEFTMRAVLNGKIDLASAEAVAAVTGAKSVRAAQMAQRALRGGLHDALQAPRAHIVDALAELEARLDFPDEPLGDAVRTSLVTNLQHAHASLVKLVEGARRGRRLHDGARVVLWGAPNAGKSTLLNALCGQQRALVDDAPGTTRDSLEVMLDVGGVPMTIVDVAGVRDGEGVSRVEGLGIARAREEVARADVIVVVVAIDDVDPAPPLPEHHAVVINVTSKTDLEPTLLSSNDHGVAVSSHTGAGLVTLSQALVKAVGLDDDEPPLSHTARQEQRLCDAATAIDSAVAAISSALPDEIACSELRRAGLSLDGLLGGDLSADVLDVVFSRFCIGK